MPKPAPSFESGELREVGELLRGRRTINLYLGTAVPGQLVDDAIEAATWAPNHHVTEPWHFYRFGPRTIGRTIELVRGITAAAKGEKAGDFKAESWSEKPGWLLVTCRHDPDPLREREDFAACAAAVQNLQLYLWKAGVGCKWTTGAITRDPRFFEIAGVDPAREFVVALLWYGYPKVTPTQQRRPAAEVSTHLP